MLHFLSCSRCLQPLCGYCLCLSHPDNITQPVEVVLLDALVLGDLSLLVAISHHVRNGGDVLTACHPILSVIAVNNNVLDKNKVLCR